MERFAFRRMPIALHPVLRRAPVQSHVRKDSFNPMQLGPGNNTTQDNIVVRGDIERLLKSSDAPKHRTPKEGRWKVYRHLVIQSGRIGVRNIHRLPIVPVQHVAAKHIALVRLLCDKGQRPGLIPVTGEQKADELASHHHERLVDRLRGTAIFLHNKYGEAVSVSFQNLRGPVCRFPVNDDVLNCIPALSSQAFQGPFNGPCCVANHSDY